MTCELLRNVGVLKASMTSISFTPRHAQPFTLDQAMLLEVDMLVAEVSRLENSLSHLRKTQEELVGYIRDDPDGDDDGELGKAVEENDQVIASQTERITLIKVALLNKVGEGGVRHMGLSLDDEARADAGQIGDIARTGRPPGEQEREDSGNIGGLDRRDTRPEPDTEEEGVFL